MRTTRHGVRPQWRVEIELHRHGVGRTPRTEGCYRTSTPCETHYQAQRELAFYREAFVSAVADVAWSSTVTMRIRGGLPMVTR